MVKRGRNIEGLLAGRLTGGGADRGTHGYKMGNQTFYDTEGEEGKNFFKATDRHYNKDNWKSGDSPFLQGAGPDYSDLSDPIIKKARDKQNAMLDAQMMDKENIGEFEGKEVAEMNAVLADPKSSPPISKIGSLLSAEGESPLDQAGNEYMGRREVEEEFAAMENPPEDSLGDKLGSYLGQAGDYVGGLFSPEEKEYQDVSDSEGENRYVNKLARERFEKKQAVYGRDDLDQRGPTVDVEGESELDRIGRENKILRGKEASMADFGEEEEGSTWDSIKGLFASDEIGETGKKKKKKMSKGAMKVGADLLKGYLEEPAQGKRQMATSSITRGSVPFAGLLAQKAQRQKAPYYTPRGLV
jgi:hypothetical protein